MGGNDKPSPHASNLLSSTGPSQFLQIIVFIIYSSPSHRSDGDEQVSKRRAVETEPGLNVWPAHNGQQRTNLTRKSNIIPKSNTIPRVINYGTF